MPTVCRYYVADPERCARVAGIAVAHARLRHIPPADRKIAIMLSAYPTKHSRIGNAVGLDTPVSAIRLFRAMRAAGYDLGPADGPDALPGLAPLDPIDERGAGHHRRQRADPRADRRRRAGRGMADRRAAERQPGADPGRHGTPTGSASCPPS